MEKETIKLRLTLNLEEEHYNNFKSLAKAYAEFQKAPASDEEVFLYCFYGMVQKVQKQAMTEVPNILDAPKETPI